MTVRRTIGVMCRCQRRPKQGGLHDPSRIARQSAAHRDRTMIREICELSERVVEQALVIGNPWIRDLEFPPKTSQFDGLGATNSPNTEGKKQRRSWQ